jgi:hypothetical protein
VDPLRTRTVLDVLDPWTGIAGLEHALAVDLLEYLLNASFCSSNPGAPGCAASTRRHREGRGYFTLTPLAKPPEGGVIRTSSARRASPGRAPARESHLPCGGPPGVLLHAGDELVLVVRFSTQPHSHSTLFFMASPWFEPARRLASWPGLWELWRHIAEDLPYPKSRRSATASCSANLGWAAHRVVSCLRTWSPSASAQ